MTLVAGLVIAGLAGIVAAFYYSTRPGRSRVRAGARPDRAGAARFAGNSGRNAPPSSSRTVRSPSSGRSAGSTSRRTWRKGTDVDEELWPIETFGGVSDEQFWNDLAADRPLAATARTARADSGPSTQPTRAYPAPATRAAAADRTAVQAAVRAAAPSPMTAHAYPGRTRPSATGTQPVRAAHQLAESRGRRSATAGGPGTGEDPLTSPAYSLRAKGAVDGHSYQSSDRYRADPLGPDGYSPGSSASAGMTGAPAYQPGPGSAGRYGGAAADPYRGHPRSQSTRATHSASTPPYGDRYGYRNPVSPADDLTSATGNRGQGRPGGNGTGEGHWGSHRAYPPVSGYRSPYDPRGNGRR